jgi:16S rRNA (cytosine967-C5)-methyltransferase
MALPAPRAWAEALGTDPPCRGPYLFLTPARHGTDGFFVALFERRINSAEQPSL